MIVEKNIYMSFISFHIFKYIKLKSIIFIKLQSITINYKQETNNLWFQTIVLWYSNQTFLNFREYSLMIVEKNTYF